MDEITFNLTAPAVRRKKQRIGPPAGDRPIDGLNSIATMTV
jgi:hypothetical protein